MIESDAAAPAAPHAGVVPPAAAPASVDQRRIVSIDITHLVRAALEADT